jgi:predicted amidophosphoribosyltransferase
LAAMPAKRFYVWARSRRRTRRGLCAGCGYDLRGGGQRCPECGRPI